MPTLVVEKSLRYNVSFDVENPSQQFGGAWTWEKLGILRNYLNQYTTALKNQPFTLHYVDAFAGAGAIEAQGDANEEGLFLGSPKVALGIEDKPFDRLIFIEIDQEKAASLRTMITQGNNADRAQAITEDANQYLPRFCAAMEPYDRAVVFLDPFGTQVNWETVQAIADTEKCDTWILFPVSAIRRLLPRRGEVRSQGNELRLTKVFGDESWRDLQRLSKQVSLFGEVEIQTDSGVKAIVDLYRSKLEGSFTRVAPVGRTLRNSRNSPMYEFLFAVGNPNGARTAIKIADHILNKL